jgi:urea carboxylase
MLTVLAAGPMTTVQEHPGRQGLWPVGVPPAGPKDAFSFRLANQAVGNDGGTAALEITVGGLHVRFDVPTTFALGGAFMGATLDGEDLPLYEPVWADAGAELRVTWAPGPGLRSYLAVHGGIDVPAVLGSRATFPLGRFGGFEGRALKAGDVVPLSARCGVVRRRGLRHGLRPVLRTEWELRVRRGPHDDPEFFTESDLSAVFDEPWTVGAQSDRTGVRLEGPTPEWARLDGGDAGLHPSNLHDNAYVVGSLIFTGDAPVLVGPDGPSLGGFLSPCVVTRADLWKLGQLRPGDTVRFVPVGERASASTAEHQDRWLDPASRFAWAVPARAQQPLAVDDVVVRRTGDGALLVELGDNQLDLRQRLRAHVLETRLREVALPGIEDLTAGIRSLQVQFDPRAVAATDVQAAIADLVADTTDLDALVVPSRIVHLPLSYDDPSAHEAMQRYQRLVRPDAPWCPDNIEFIRRVNGLGDRDEVRSVVFDASYLVMGLGDVYLGAPVAVPLDPRHRLVTTKYNPARTWTPENAVGIGGTYLCVYGMEGPGGYQLVGRTTQVWNPHAIPSGTPWRLRTFDQIRFFPVSGEDLLRRRAEYEAPLAEETTFSLADHAGFVGEHAEEIGVFRTRQQAAFTAEREAWKAAA